MLKTEPGTGWLIRALLAAVALPAGSSALAQAQPVAALPDASAFSVVEAGIPELQAAMAEGRTTAREITEQYLARIGLYENLLNAAITVNPNALAEAERLDREREAGNIRGPLHGIPIALKDNIHTTDMPTTGGALAFEGFVPPYDATITENLRRAGAIIIAKTVLTELANWVAGDPFDMPDNYSSLSGYSFNPYDPRKDPRPGSFDGRPVLSPGGSSSGIGTAASLWAANVGTETSGSILHPSNMTMLVGIKPTVGRLSRWGIIPITADQDTAGPMARTVADAAILLGALESESADPNDPATERCEPPPGNDYTRFLDPQGLAGARIGIPRAGYYQGITAPGAFQPQGALSEAQAASMAQAIAALREQGAVIVDPANLPSVVTQDPSRNLLLWEVCAGGTQSFGRDGSCSVVFKYGMKRDFNAWLATLGADAPLRSLTELRQWNLMHRAASTIKYEQARLDISDEVDLVRDRARYQADRAKDIELAGTLGIDAVIDEHRLDALLFPGSRGSSTASRPGYPSIAVPFGMVPNEPTPPFPDGFEAKPMPFGVMFTGRACSEPRLIEIAYAFEQATRRRVPPPATP